MKKKIIYYFVFKNIIFKLSKFDFLHLGSTGW